MIIYVRQERNTNSRTQVLVVISLIILISISLGIHMLYKNSRLKDWDNLQLMYQTQDSNVYVYTDILLNQPKIIYTKKFNESVQFQKFHSQHLSKCYRLEVNKPTLNSLQTNSKKFSVLKQIFYVSKQIYPSLTKPKQYQPNQIEILQKDCQDHDIYINNDHITLLLLEWIFKHLQSMKILKEKQYQQLLKQKINFNLNINEKHTMDINKYLNARFSYLLQIILESQPHFISINIFIGDLNDLVNYYESERIIYVKNQGSYKYYLQQNGNDYKLIVTGIANVQRLNNFLIILKYYGIDFEKVIQIGSISEYKQKNTNTLKNLLEELDVVPKIAYLGNRKQGLIELAKKLYMDELRFVTQDFEEYAIQLLKIRNKLITKSINGIFRYSYLIIGENINQQGIIFFRMPNGELSFEAIKILLNIGVKQFFMIGAGGAINPNLAIGDYIQINRSFYNEKEVSTNPNKIINLINFNIIQDGSNITIDSPLEETQNWLYKHMKLDCVDVETFHILKALEESLNDVKYLPGIFISDVLTQKPLQDKIGDNNAYRSFSNFMQSTFVYLNL